MSTPTPESNVVDLVGNVLVFLRRDVPGEEPREGRCDALVEMAVTKQPTGEASGSLADSNEWRLCKLSVTVTRQENYQAFWKGL